MPSEPFISIPRAPQPRRLAVLFDGFNFYYGLKRHRDQYGICYYWQDLLRLSRTIIQEGRGRGLPAS
jgi:hypothetical protein